MKVGILQTLVWVGLYGAELSYEWVVRMVGFSSLDAFKQMSGYYGGVVYKAS